LKSALKSLDRGEREGEGRKITSPSNNLPRRGEKGTGENLGRKSEITDEEKRTQYKSGIF